MEEKKPTTEIAQPIVTEPTAPVVDDAEARIASLEAEKNTLLESQANYKLAYLKEVKKNNDLSDDDEEKMRKIAQEAVANSRIADIAREQDAIIKKALKENKELKLANLSKTPIPSSTSAHSEGPIVKDTLITPEQLTAFKAKGWTEKDIERYKKNLQKYGGR